MKKTVKMILTDLSAFSNLHIFAFALFSPYLSLYVFFWNYWASSVPEMMDALLALYNHCVFSKTRMLLCKNFDGQNQKITFWRLFLFMIQDGITHCIESSYHLNMDQVLSPVFSWNLWEAKASCFVEYPLMLGLIFSIDLGYILFGNSIKKIMCVFLGESCQEAYNYVNLSHYWWCALWSPG